MILFLEKGSGFHSRRHNLIPPLEHGDPNQYDESIFFSHKRCPQMHIVFSGGTVRFWSNPTLLINLLILLYQANRGGLCGCKVNMPLRMDACVLNHGLRLVRTNHKTLFLELNIFLLYQFMFRRIKYRNTEFIHVTCQQILITIDCLVVMLCHYLLYMVYHQ